MRHYLQQAVFGIAALLLSLSAYAQDIIVTTDAKKIDAKITEVSKSEIRYKEKDYLDGPTFVISTDEISSIIYANGKVVLYSQPSSPAPKSAPEPEVKPEPKPEVKQPVIDESIAEIALLSGQTIEARIVEMKSDHVTYVVGDEESTLSASQIKTVTFKNGQVKYYSQTSYEAEATRSTPEQKVSQRSEEGYASSRTIYKADEFQGGTLPRFIYTKVHVPDKKNPKNRYVGGNMVLTEREFYRFLELHCPEAYAYCKKARLFLILECVSILVGLVPVIIFAVLGLNNSAQILPTYNNMCAGHNMAAQLQPYFQDNVQLATIVQK